MIITEFHPESKHVSVIDKDTRERHNMVVLFDTETKRAIVYATDKKGNVIFIKRSKDSLREVALVHTTLTNCILVDKDGNEMK